MGSLCGQFTKSLDDRSCRLTRGQRYDDDFPAPRADFPRANDRLDRVVAAFHDDIGMEMKDQLERCVLLEANHCVDHRERSKHVTALRQRANGPGGSFQSPHGGIAVHADDERLALTPSGQ